jgi:hypothetical protein
MTLSTFTTTLLIGAAVVAAELGVHGWRICDVSEQPFFAAGDGTTSDTTILRAAIDSCDEVRLGAGEDTLSNTGPSCACIHADIHFNHPVHHCIITS